MLDAEDTAVDRWKALSLIISSLVTDRIPTYLPSLHVAQVSLLPRQSLRCRHTQLYQLRILPATNFGYSPTKSVVIEGSSGGSSFGRLSTLFSILLATGSLTPK